MIRRAATMIILAFATMIATAGELIIHTVSYHSADNKPFQTVEQWTENYVTYQRTTSYPGYNNINPGLGYATDDGYQVGAYYNSYRKLSVYGSKTWMYNRYVGVMVGLATGYKQERGLALAPVGALVFAAPVSSSMTLRLLALPPLSSNARGVVHLTVGYKM